MEKGLFKKLALLLTYVIVLVAVIVKIDVVSAWFTKALGAFTPLFVGLAIAFVLHQPCNFFARLYGKKLTGTKAKAARPLAVATSYVLFFAVIAALFSIVVPELVDSIRSFIGNLSTYGSNLQAIYDFVVEKLNLEMLGQVNLSETINGAISKLLSGVLDALTTTLPHLISATSALVSAVVTTLLSLVFSVYMLGSAPKLVGQCRRLTVQYLPKRISDTVLSVAKLTTDTFTGYVSGQLIEACILGVLCFIGMCIFGFAYAPLISVIIAVCALVPIAGAYIGAAISILLLLMIDPMQAVWFAVFLIILQQLEGNLIYPRVVGTSIGLPGIWVLAAVTVGSTLMGFAGLLFGVPLAAILYTLLRKDLHRREQNPKTKPPKDPTK